MEFIVFYEHTEYGYYSTVIEGNDIEETLNFFISNYVYKDIYGIMAKK
jgi:hypothetical protein